MDIFDRLGNLIKTILDDDPSAGARSGFADADERAAWEELEQYMEDGKGEPKPSFDARPSTAISPTLRKDFRNLEVAPGAPFEQVQRAYKTLLTAFHPDRHAADAEKFRTATEVTKKLNESYTRIRAFYEQSRGRQGAG